MTFTITLFLSLVAIINASQNKTYYNVSHLNNSYPYNNTQNFNFSTLRGCTRRHNAAGISPPNNTGSAKAGQSITAAWIQAPGNGVGVTTTIYYHVYIQDQSCTTNCFSSAEASSLSTRLSAIMPTLSTQNGMDIAWVSGNAQNMKPHLQIYKSSTNPPDCSADVGLILNSDDNREMFLGGWCLEHNGMILHLLGHVLGLEDENTRPDKGDYLVAGSTMTHPPALNSMSCLVVDWNPLQHEPNEKNAENGVDSTEYLGLTGYDLNSFMHMPIETLLVWDGEQHRQLSSCWSDLTSLGSSMASCSQITKQNVGSWMDSLYYQSSNVPSLSTLDIYAINKYYEKYTASGTFEQRFPCNQYIVSSAPTLNPTSVNPPPSPTPPPTPPPPSPPPSDDDDNSFPPEAIVGTVLGSLSVIGGIVKYIDSRNKNPASVASVFGATRTNYPEITMV